MDGECHDGKREVVCWSMEVVTICRMCCFKAERDVRCIGGEAWRVRV